MGFRSSWNGGAFAVVLFIYNGWPTFYTTRTLYSILELHYILRPLNFNDQQSINCFIDYIYLLIAQFTVSQSLLTTARL